jgi:CRISPR-associated endoribonuclease Cas6
MKLEVILDTDQLPVHYHFLFVSIIKNAISRISKEKMESLYYFQDKINKQGKNFSFAVYLSDFIMEKDIFHINGYIKWTISSNDYAFLLYLYDGLITQEKFTYQNATLRVKSIRTIESQKIKSRKCIFQTLSPITVKGKNGRFLSIEDPDFTKEYIYICRKIIFNNADRNPLEPLFFKPLNMKSVMVQVKHKDFDKLNKDSILFVKAYKGLFELQGHPEDLNILSQTGASFRKSQGFGCIELISQS